MLDIWFLEVYNLFSIFLRGVLMHKSSGEQSALFPKVFPVCLPKIKAMAAGFRSGEFTEDLIQEGLAALYYATLVYDEKRGVPFEGFAMPCIRNAMISALRKNNNIPAASLYEVEDIPSLNTPDNYALLKDDFQNIKALIVKALSPMEYKVLSMYLNGYSYAQAAVALGKSEKSIDNAMSRVRKKLSNLLR